MIYCPSIVGTRNDCHTTDGIKKSGKKVVIMCGMRSAIAMRSHRGMRNAIPITISNIPSTIPNMTWSTAGKVISRSPNTSGLAGLRLITFNRPNQMNTVPSASLAYGIASTRTSFMSVVSSVYNGERLCIN